MRQSAILALLTLWSTSAHAQEVQFERQIAPFSVLDENGEAYQFPFFGGFNSPRPQLVDLTGSGFPDLVVQEVFDRLIVYRNDHGDYQNLEWESDQWQELEVGSWFRFGDLTGDGLPDLLTNRPPGGVRLYLNVGTATQPDFELVTDLLLDTEGRPVVAEDPNVPAIADINGDGLGDLFFGQADRGFIRYYRNAGLEDGIPQFELMTDRFQGIEIYEASPTCDPFKDPVYHPMPDERTSGPNVWETEPEDILHGENALTFADVNGDGLLELYWGDFFTSSLYFFDNQGTPTEPQMTFVAPRYPVDQPLTSAGYNVPAFGNVRGNDVLDLVIGSVGGFCSSTANLIENLFFLENQGEPSHPNFEMTTSRLISGIDVGRVSIPMVVDLEGRGQPDLIVGSAYYPGPTGPERGSLVRFQNIGSIGDPAYQLTDPDFLRLDLDFANHYAPTSIDFGAGATDIVIGTFGGRLYRLRNQGFAGFFSFGDPEPLMDTDGRPVRIGQTAYPTFADLDGDGLPDLVVGSFRGNLSYFRNVGRAGEPVFELVTDRFLDFDHGRFSAPHFADLSNNGSLDLLIGTEFEGLFIYRNVGFPHEPEFNLIHHIQPGRAQLTPAAADLTGDGKPDIILGTRAGGLLFYQNQ